MKAKTTLISLHRIDTKYFAVVETVVEIKVSKEYFDSNKLNMVSQASVFDECYKVKLSDGVVKD